MALRKALAREDRPDNQIYLNCAFELHLFIPCLLKSWILLSFPGTGCYFWHQYLCSHQCLITLSACGSPIPLLVAYHKHCSIQRCWGGEGLVPSGSSSDSPSRSFWLISRGKVLFNLRKDNAQRWYIQSQLNWNQRARKKMRETADKRLSRAPCIKCSAED